MDLAVLGRLSKVGVAELYAALGVDVIADDLAFTISKRVDVASCGHPVTSPLFLLLDDIVLLLDGQAFAASPQTDSFSVVQNQGVWILIGMVAALNVEVGMRSNAGDRFADGGEKTLYSLGRSSPGH